jgi:hypothetical protein
MVNFISSSFHFAPLLAAAGVMQAHQSIEEEA